MPSIIEALVREHCDFREVFAEIEAGLARLKLGQLKEVAQNLERLLLSHAAAEDDLVLLAQARLPEKKRRYERFRKEHLEIDGELTQIYSLGDVVSARALLRAVMTYSERHFLHEERIIFPLLEQVIEPETLRRLGTVWTLRRNGRLRFPVASSSEQVSVDLRGPRVHPFGVSRL